jgi:hypothetical protein
MRYIIPYRVNGELEYMNEYGTTCSADMASAIADCKTDIHDSTTRKMIAMNEFNRLKTQYFINQSYDQIVSNANHILQLDSSIQHSECAMQYNQQQLELLQKTNKRDTCNIEYYKRNVYLSIKRYTISLIKFDALITQYFTGQTYDQILENVNRIHELNICIRNCDNEIWGRQRMLNRLIRDEVENAEYEHIQIHESVQQELDLIKQHSIAIPNTFDNDYE